MRKLFYACFVMALITSCTLNEDDAFPHENSDKSLHLRTFNGCQSSDQPWGDVLASHLDDLVWDCQPQNSPMHGTTLVVNSFFNEFGPYTSDSSSYFGMRSSPVTYSIAEQDQIIVDAKAAAQGWIQNKTQTDPNYYHLRYKTPVIQYRFTEEVIPHSTFPAYFFSLEIKFTYERPILRPM